MLRFKARRKDPTESPFLTPSQRRVMGLLGSAMQEVRNAVIRNEGLLLDAVLHGPSTRFDTLVPSDPWFDVQAALQEELFAELVAGGERYGALLPVIRKATIKFRFDATRPEAATWAAKEAGLRIVEIIEEQRAVVRDFVARASMGELAPRQVARGLRDVVGLTSAQAGWVENFRNRQIAELQAAGLSPQQVADRAERATARYHSRIHRYRTETIARTEILSASHEGRRQAWNQGMQQGFISPGALQQWSTNVDGRACTVCISYDEWTTPINSEFPEGDPPLHPNCRCDVLLIDVPPELVQFQDLTDEELDAAIEEVLTGEVTTGIAVAPEWQPAFSEVFATGARFFDDNRSGPRWGNEKFAAWQDKWEDTPNGQAVRNYSSEGSVASYKDINDRLRLGQFDDAADEVNDAIRQIGQAVDDAVVPEDVIGIRGLTADRMPEEMQSLFSEIQPGALIHDPGFMSISLADKPALGTDIYIRVRVPAGSRGAYLGKLSKYRDQEQELLLQSGTTLRVIATNRETYRLYVDAEVVAQNFASARPPAELLKGRLSYLTVMADSDSVEKRAPAPLAPEFDEDGNMIRMGQKLNSPMTGIVIVPAPSR